MAMTGKHAAMATANTVFLKCRHSAANVAVGVVESSSESPVAAACAAPAAHAAGAVSAASLECKSDSADLVVDEEGGRAPHLGGGLSTDEGPTSAVFAAVEEEESGYMVGVKPLLTSSHMPLRALHEELRRVKDGIHTSLGTVVGKLWRPVVATPNHKFGWRKTIGTSLPEI